MSTAHTRAATYGARFAASLMGETFTRSGEAGSFVGVMSPVDENTRMLLAGYAQDVTLQLYALTEQFSNTFTRSEKITLDGTVFHVRDIKTDPVYTVLYLFKP